MAGTTAETEVALGDWPPTVDMPSYDYRTDGLESHCDIGDVIEAAHANWIWTACMALTCAGAGGIADAELAAAVVSPAVNLP